MKKTHYIWFSNLKRSQSIWFIIFTFLIFFISCQNNSKKVESGDKHESDIGTDINHTKDNSVPPSAEKIKLDVIFPIPDTIDGCGDYYTYDSIDLKSDKYVFVTRMGEVAIISIGDSLVYLNNNTSKSKSTEDVIYEEFVGNGVKVTLEVKKYNQYSEGGFFKGNLTIVVGSRKEILKVHGQSGC